MMVPYTNLQGGNIMNFPPISDIPDRLQDLEAEDVQVYGWAASNGSLTIADAAVGLGLPPDRVTRAVRSLAAVALLREVSVPQGTAENEVQPAEPTWKAVDPQVAGAEVAATESRLRRGLAELFSVWDTLDSLTAVYAAGTTPNAWEAAPLEVIESLDSAIEVIEHASAACRNEVMTSQPGGGRPAAELEQAFERDLAMIERGVRMRSLYQHTSRHHAPTQEYVERVTTAGAEVRTLAELFGRMLAFDRSVVFLPHHAVKGGAVVVREPSIVAFLCSGFDRAWSMASPYSPTAPDRSVRNDVKVAILSMLSEGMRDETIARRLGISLRTCRKYVADIFEELGAESRFQAGYLTRSKDLLNIDTPGENLDGCGCTAGP